MKEEMRTRMEDKEELFSWNLYTLKRKRKGKGSGIKTSKGGLEITGDFSILSRKSQLTMKVAEGKIGLINIRS